MVTIATIPPNFWDSVSMRAAEPQIVYLGPMPELPSNYYPMAYLMPPKGISAFVYLLLSCDGSVLYAGKARNPGNRFDKHRSKKDWWYEVENLMLIRLSASTREEADGLALHVESLCIRRLDPIYNIAGARRRPGMCRGVYA